MSAQILDGKVLAAKLKDALKAEVQQLIAQTKKTPTIINIMVGEDPAALSYVSGQRKAAEYIGIKFELKTFPLDITQEKLSQTIRQFSNDPNIHGIMIQKPVPLQIDYQVVNELIDPIKSLEGVNIPNFGKMMFGKTKIFPCTAAAVMELLETSGVDVKGKEAVIIGRSEIIGKPLMFLLLEKNATVTVCHLATDKAGKLPEHIGRADILVAAAGRPKMVKGEWIKKGAIVIDVGTNSIDNKIVGDVDFDSAKERAGFISPVPGGVGPVTSVILMRNAVESFKFYNK